MYEKNVGMKEEPVAVKDRTYVVTDSIERAEKMVNVAYEALLTLKERLSSVMCDCPPTAVPASEGIEKQVEKTDSLENILNQYSYGIKSAMTYLNAATLSGLRENVTWVNS